MPRCLTVEQRHRVPGEAGHDRLPNPIGGLDEASLHQELYRFASIPANSVPTQCRTKGSPCQHRGTIGPITIKDCPPRCTCDHRFRFVCQVVFDNLAKLGSSRHILAVQYLMWCRQLRNMFGQVGGIHGMAQSSDRANDPSHGLSPDLQTDISITLVKVLTNINCLPRGTRQWQHMLSIHYTLIGDVYDDKLADHGPPGCSSLFCVQCV